MLYQTTIPNLGAVDQGLNILRGGQPLAADYQKLWDGGIRNIIELNTPSEHQGLTLVNWLPMGGKLYSFPIGIIEQVFTRPDDQGALDTVSAIEPNTFIHCGSVQRTQEFRSTGDPAGKGGNDRTGWLVMLKRILRQGWTFDQAMTEAIKYDFHWEEEGLRKSVWDFAQP